MCANEEHRGISFYFGCRVFVLWQNTNRNRMGFHIETEPFPRWLRLCLIASINKGYSLRISRVEFSQAFQPEVFPARDRVWVLKQGERERERDTSGAKLKLRSNRTRRNWKCSSGSRATPVDSRIPFTWNLLRRLSESKIIARCVSRTITPGCLFFRSFRCFVPF